MKTQPDVAKSGLSFVAWGRVFHLGRHRHAGQLPLGMVSSRLGIIILATQCARWLMGMKMEGFWIACATVFIAGGLWTESKSANGYCQ
jgi:hypothetical protein